MKTFNYKLASVKSYAMTIGFIIALSFSTQSVFSQSISNSYQFNLLDEDHYEDADWGSGSKDYKWRMSYDVFDYGIWVIDRWTPMGSYGHMDFVEFRKVGFWSSIFSELTLEDAQGYGNYYPGTENVVTVKCNDTGVDPVSGRPYNLTYTKSHRYLCGQ